MTVAGKVARNTTAVVAGKVAALACSLLLIQLLTRELGPLGFGRYVVALVFAQLFGLAADLGVNVIALKRLATPGPADSAWVGMALGLRVATVAALAVVAAAVASVAGYDIATRQAILAALLGMAVQAFTAFFAAILQARLQSQRAAAAEAAGRVVTLALAFAVLRGGGGVVAVLLAQAAGTALQLGWTAAAALRLVACGRVWQPGRWRATLAESLPVGVSTLLGFVYFKADTLILSRVPLRGGRDNALEVGIYGAAYKVLEIVILVPGIFVGTLFPVVADAVHRGDRERAGHLVERAARLMLYFGAAAGATVWLYAAEIIGWIAGPLFAAAVLPLRILALGIAVNAVATVFTYSALALGRQARLAMVYGAAAVLNVAANWILIPRAGYTAAAAVTVATEVLVAVGALWVCGRTLPLRRAGLYWSAPLAGVAAGAGAAAALRPVEPWLGLAAAAIVFAAGAHWTGVVRFDEVRRAFTRRPTTPVQNPRSSL